MSKTTDHFNIDERLDKLLEAQERDREAQERNRKALEKYIEAQERDRKAQSIRQKEFDESLVELRKNVKESAKESNKLEKNINKFVGESDNKWGKFIEILTSSSALRLLKDRGIDIEVVSTRVRDFSPNRRWEIDVLAVNGKEAVAIEVKRYLRKQDVDEFIKTLHQFKVQHKECAKKILYGGVAYLECEEKVSKYAEQKGLFVFQATGNSAILDNKSTFNPKPIKIIDKN